MCVPSCDYSCLSIPKQDFNGSGFLVGGSVVSEVCSLVLLVPYMAVFHWMFCGSLECNNGWRANEHHVTGGRGVT